jgi:hypothetical protein
MNPHIDGLVLSISHVDEESNRIYRSHCPPTPQWNTADIGARIGYAYSNVERSMENGTALRVLGLERNANGNFMTVDQFHSEFATLLPTAMILRDLMTAAASEDEDDMPTLRSLIYMIHDELGITVQRAMFLVNRCFRVIEWCTNIPRNYLFVKCGDGNEKLFGMFVLRSNNLGDIARFHLGSWTNAFLKSLMMRDEVHDNDLCTFSDGLRSVRYFVTVEKVEMARRFWRGLNTTKKESYLILSSQGQPTTNMYLMKSSLGMSFIDRLGTTCITGIICRTVILLVFPLV